MLKNKMLSILGDSISTYQGVSNDATAHPTLIDNAVFYRPVFKREETYWDIILRELGMKLCVNNSYSGGNLSGKDSATSGISRARYLARADGTTPDLIIVFMGINDLGRRVPLATFAEDYRSTLLTLRDTYPEASVLCVNIPDRDILLKKDAALFNEAIASAVTEAGDRFFLADLFTSRFNNDLYYFNTLDGLHPDRDGMRILADIILEAVRENFCDT